MSTASKASAGIDSISVKSGPAVVPSVGAPGADAVSVDKIRDILFGNQMQDYDRRFSQIDERFQQKLRDLESETTRHMGTVEASLKKQLDSIANQMVQEKELRSDSDKELERSLRDHAQSLEKRIGQLSDQLSRFERDFIERLTQETQALRDELKRRNDDTRANVEKMFAELSGVKTDRNLLAGLFVEIAKCLNQDVASKGFAKTGSNDHHG
jgi:DNA repair exonuclease SbcCD ATPase subunit